MKLLLLPFLLLFIACSSNGQKLQCGADQPDAYLHLLKDKQVGLVVNQSSRVGDEHLLDFLLEHDIDVESILCPEHGFRGDADAGEHVSDEKDAKTGLPVISLYGDNKKPTAEQLKGLDVLVYDIQDVGVRFYTYISTLHYVMEACAENKVELIVLDRPNPNGDYVAGPVLDLKYRSFVGMHPIPVVHGCTLGEMAQMINGEKWLENGVQCQLTVIPVANYSHQDHYSVPIKPSPNLPNDLSIRLYPSLCFFEATNMSIGRGTYFPFQVIGYPDSTFGEFTFTPKSIDGMAKSPKQQDKLCYGQNLQNETMDHQFTLDYFIQYYQRFASESDFLSSERWFNLLAGDAEVLKLIRAGANEKELEASWADKLEKYRQMRKQYLLYPDSSSND